MTETFIMTVIGIIGVFTYMAFNDYRLFEKFKFHVDSILVEKQYYRLFSSGFLHVDWMHFAFNMYAFYIFADAVANIYGLFHLVAVTLLGLLGGNLLALYIHRNHGNYTAVGFSGAVSAVVFYSVALVPHGGIGLIFIPGFFIPSWLFAVLYMMYSLYGIIKQHDNLGHEAHAGGAVLGIVYGVLAFPAIAMANWLYLLPMALVTLLLLYIVFFRQDMLLTGSTLLRPSKPVRDDGPPVRKAIQEARDLDEVLDKINRTGIDSLTPAERRILERGSRR